jgi:dTDP-4-dehydrorhamnose reductase
MDSAAKVMILGATGMLGQALSVEGRRRGYKILGLARSGTDINVDVADRDELAAVLVKSCPDIVINCAATTSVDGCERDPGRAYLINARSVSVLSETAAKVGSYLIQISTDHYYSGHGAVLHSETAPVTLFNEYARTKYAGERFALTNPGALVVRTNIVGLRGRPGQPTFVEWVIQTLQQGLPMTLFDDYLTSSIDVLQFSTALYDLLPARPGGVLNIAARQVSSKREFVEALAKRLSLPTLQCEIGSVRSLPGAPRAESLGLDVSKAEQLLARLLPDLPLVVESLIQEFRNTE